MPSKWDTPYVPDKVYRAAWDALVKVPAGRVKVQEPITQATIATAVRDASKALGGLSPAAATHAAKVLAQDLRAACYKVQRLTKAKPQAVPLPTAWDPRQEAVDLLEEMVLADFIPEEWADRAESILSRAKALAKSES